jgi:hypothetical protein
MRPLSMTRSGLRTAGLVVVLLIAGVTASSGFSPVGPVAVASGPDGAARIKLADGRTVVVSTEPGQADIAAGLIAPDGTVGWLAEFRVEDVGYPVAQVLVIWRAGKIIRRFPTDQSFYSWTFYAGSKQVAYHVGPLHGERSAHCELHDVARGNTVAVWDGDLDVSNGRPVWTEGLSR